MMLFQSAFHEISSHSYAEISKVMKFHDISNFPTDEIFWWFPPLSRREIIVNCDKKCKNKETINVARCHEIICAYQFEPPQQMIELTSKFGRCEAPADGGWHSDRKPHGKQEITFFVIAAPTTLGCASHHSTCPCFG